MEADAAGPAPAALRDISGLAAWSQRLLVAQAALGAMAVAVALHHGAGFDDEDGSAAYALVSLVQFLLFLVTSITFLCWTYHASANVHRLGAQGLGPSPGWAVGWYFVPIASLAMPFQAMRETWKASVEPRDWEIVRVSPMLGWWWACWLLSSIAGAAALRLGYEERLGDTGRIAEHLTTASDLLGVPASLLLAAIVGRVTAQQSAR